MRTGTIPMALRVHLAHAVVQSIADECGARILHVKGPAVDPSLRPIDEVTLDDGTVERRPRPRLSSDADVLVHPADLDAYMAALQRHGWGIVTHFETGSAFEHAASLWHQQLGYVDVHRRFPGIKLEPRKAFDELWRHRSHVQLAHFACAVPSVHAQRFILLLHAARGGGPTHPDARRLWGQAGPAEREAMLSLADTFQAQVALAAATGRLADFSGSPDALLWRLFSEQQPQRRLSEWRARLRATSGNWPKARLAMRALVVNTDHLGMRLGHRPSKREILCEYGRRSGNAFHELLLARRLILRRRQDDR